MSLIQELLCCPVVNQGVISLRVFSQSTRPKLSVNQMGFTFGIVCHLFFLWFKPLATKGNLEGSHKSAILSSVGVMVIGNCIMIINDYSILSNCNLIVI